MLKLYLFGNSVCAQKVLITLNEKGLEFDTQNINLFANEQYDPAYLKLNPKGVVPTLQHDEHIVIESTLICEYLDDTFPSPDLIPEDPFLRCQMRLWSKAVDEGIFEATRELSFSAMFREKMKKMSVEQRERRFLNVGDPERRARFLSTYQEGVNSKYVFEGVAAYEKLFGNMEKSLIDGREWLLGCNYSLADVCLTPFVARLNFLNILDLWIEERPAVQSWWEKASVRPSYAIVIEDALTEDEMSEMTDYGSKIRLDVQAHRKEYLEMY